VTVVCEASSFQLEDTLAFAPEAAVLLNLAPDHLDRHGTMAAYREAKLRLFANQRQDDLAVLPLEPATGVPGEDSHPRPGEDTHPRPGESVPPRAGDDTYPRPGEGVPPRAGASARPVYFGDGPGAQLSSRDGRLLWEGRPLLSTDELCLRGAHNARNAMAAAAVCLARGVDPDAVRAGLRSFAGVAHRLEEVGRRDGVLYVNDSKATNVASTLVALDAFAGSAVHLILGGRGKGQDFTALRAPVERGCRAVYLIGADAPAIAAALEHASVPVRECGDLERALREAAAAAAEEEVVLLSPGCASFDQFTDFEDRGERFRALVRALST
jgi:UDP-N-acetylmuramoylalanine--D-glutamate ligase